MDGSTEDGSEKVQAPKDLAKIDWNGEIIHVANPQHRLQTWRFTDLALTQDLCTNLIRSSDLAVAQGYNPNPSKILELGLEFNTGNSSSHFEKTTTWPSFLLLSTCYLPVLPTHPSVCPI